MYNLLEYSQNYSTISGCLWNYYRDKVNDVDNNASYGKSFNQDPDPDQDRNQPPRPPQQPILPLSTEATISQKYLSNFRGSLDLPLINCEVGLDLKWLKIVC